MKESLLTPFGMKIELSSVTELMENRSYIFDIAHEHSFVIIRGLNSNLTENDFLEFSKNHGMNKAIQFNDRSIIDIKYIPESPNYLFSTEKVPFHFDGAFHEMPRYLIWNCVASNEVSGGETIFVNGESLIKNLDFNKENEITINYSTDKIAHYGGDVTIPIKEKHPYKDKYILRYAEPVLTEKNPLLLNINNVENQQIFINTMQNLLYSNDVTLVHEWKLGDIVIADNYSLLHGRLPLSKNVNRHIRRIHVK